jgi:hypothetical protein
MSSRYQIPGTVPFIEPMEGAPGPVTPLCDLLERYAIDDIVRAIDAGLPVFDAGRVLMTREGSFNIIRDLIELGKKPAAKRVAEEAAAE